MVQASDQCGNGRPAACLCLCILSSLLFLPLLTPASAVQSPPGDGRQVATSRDKDLAAAERIYAEASQLLEGDEESLRKALQKFQEALSLWQSLGDRAKEADTLHHVGSIYNTFGEKQKALDHLNKARALRNSTGDRKNEAKTVALIGAIYNDQGENRTALDYYNRALSLSREARDLSGEANTLNDIGTLYHDLGELQKSLEIYNQVLPLLRAAGDRRGEGQTLNNIGTVYNDVGEQQKALDVYRQALPLIREARDRELEAIVLNNTGVVYKNLGEYAKALDHFDQALRLSRAIGLRFGEAHLLTHMGGVYGASGQHQKALGLYNQSLTLRRAVGDRKGEARTLTAIGEAFKNLGEHGKAIDYFKQALTLSRTIEDRLGEAHTLDNLGISYAETGEQQKAGDSYRQSLATSRAIGDRRTEASALYHVARLEGARGDLAAARSQIEAALDIVESLRTKVASQELRASYVASIREYYEFYVDLLMRLHKERPSEGWNGVSLQVSERARARSLLEILSEAGADIRQGVDPTLLERERTLRQLLNAKAERQTRLLGSPHTKEQAAEAAEEVEKLSTEYQQIQAQIRVKSPRYASLTQPRPLSLKEIQTKVLDPDTLLLEYALGEERSYLWAVTPTSLTSFELPKRAEIEAAARRVYGLLTARNKRVAAETAERRRARVAQSDAAYAAAAAALSQMLLGPAAPQLGKKRLLIVSDGPMQYVPFAALPVPAAASNAPAGAPPPLIVEHEIVSLPSASTLSVLRREVEGRRPAAKAVAVLADPVFDKEDERVRTNSARRGAGNLARPPAEALIPSDVVRAMEDMSDTDFLRRLPRLYSTRSEAEAINSLVPARESLQSLDFAANRAAATSSELSRYRVVHFATHAFINNVHPELSGIVLSLVDEQGLPQDGFLRLHEIYNLKLPAELVVLSACRTGLGKEVKGEGLIGLTRGFMYAGTPRVLVSLWSLSDKPTAELMIRFYKKMLGAERLPPTAALRAAQIEMWRDKRWEQPYFWAAFTIQGEWK